MIRSLVLLAGAIILAGGYMVLGPLIAKLVTQAVAREERAPIPTQWRLAIEQQVAAVQALRDEQRDRLLHAVRDLIMTRHWEGCGGVALTPDMQLLIAAQACLLTLELPGEPYPNLKNVLVYPSTFVPARAADVRKWRQGSIPEPTLPELGESWSNGTVVVAWDAALAGGQDAADGRNLVIHEFAHLLDFQYGLTRGDPDLTGLLQGPNEPSPGPAIPGGDTWRPVLAASFERHCAQVESETTTLLGPYAATNEAEFFAVTTEVFFEKPAHLRAVYPELYEHFAKFFRQDPAHARDSAPGSAS